MTTSIGALCGRASTASCPAPGRRGPGRCRTVPDRRRSTADRPGLGCRIVERRRRLAGQRRMDAPPGRPPPTSATGTARDGGGQWGATCEARHRRLEADTGRARPAPGGWVAPQGRCPPRDLATGPWSVHSERSVKGNCPKGARDDWIGSRASDPACGRLPVQSASAHYAAYDVGTAPTAQDGFGPAAARRQSCVPRADCRCSRFRGPDGARVDPLLRRCGQRGDWCGAHRVHHAVRRPGRDRCDRGRRSHRRGLRSEQPAEDVLIARKRPGRPPC